jgi:hypothetical protein
MPQKGETDSQPRAYKSVVESFIIEDAYDFLCAISPTHELFRRIRPGHMLYRGHGSSTYELIPSAFRPAESSFLRQCSDWEIPEANLGTKIGQAWLEANCILEFVDHANSAGLSIPDLTTELHDELVSFVHDVAQKLLQLDLTNPKSVGSAAATFSSYSQRHPCWPKRSFDRVIAVAQHSGLPTRCLDWTYSPSVAAYFAASDCCKLLEASGGQIAPTHLEVWAVFRHRIDELFDVPGSSWHVPEVECCTVPSSGNAMLLAQRGAFTIELCNLQQCVEAFSPQSLCDRVEAKLSLYKKRKEPPVVFARYRLVASEAPKLLWLLAKEDVTASRLFPDFAGAVRSLKESLWYSNAYDDVEDSDGSADDCSG